MKAEYADDLGEFNSTYATSFTSWDELTGAEDWRALADKENNRETVDNNTFNRWCINKYYEVASAAFRAVDPHHLFRGDKINANLHDISELELLVDEIKEYVDVVLYQCFAKPDYQNQVQGMIAAASDLPYMNGDGGFGAYGDTNMQKMLSRIRIT